MVSSLTRLFESERIDKADVQRAVDVKEWITKEEYEQITGEAYPEG